MLSLLNEPRALPTLTFKHTRVYIPRPTNCKAHSLRNWIDKPPSRHGIILERSNQHRSETWDRPLCWNLPPHLRRRLAGPILLSVLKWDLIMNTRMSRRSRVNLRKQCHEINSTYASACSAQPEDNIGHSTAPVGGRNSKYLLNR
jgi:hypothetical protein